MKYKNLSIQAKAALWFTICNFLQKGISFVVVPVFTRIMSTEQYGVFTLYISWYQILNIITSLYLFNGVYDNALSKFDDDRDRVTSSFLGLTMFITVAEAGLCFLFRNTISSFLGLPLEFVLLMFIDAFLTPALAYWTARQRFEYKYVALVAVTLAKSLLTPILAIILVQSTGGMAIGRAIAINISDLGFCGVMLVTQLIKGKVLFSKKYWKYAIKIGIPVIPHYLSGMILTQGDRIVIDKVFGKTEVGLYGLASSIGMLVQVFVSSVNSAITPWMYDRMKNGRATDMKNTLTALMVFMAIVAMGLMLICPELVWIFGSAKYVDAVTSIPPIAASVFFIFLYNILSFPQFFFEKTSFLSIASIIAAALNVVLNIIFVPIFGFVAAAYTTLVCYALYSFGHWVISDKILKKEGQESYVDRKVMFILSAIMVFSPAVITLILDCFVIRYGVVLVMLIGFTLNYRRIVNIVSSIRKK